MTNKRKEQQRYSYPGCQVAEATTFAWVLTMELHVTLLAPKILKWLLALCIFVHP